MVGRKIGCNNNQTAGKQFMLAMLTLKIRGGMGSPVRPVAFSEE
jgi:kynurenine formamidase